MVSRQSHPRVIESAVSSPESITVRHDLHPGDLGAVVRLHGVLYAKECGFDSTFEAYVAGPMAEFVKRGAARERLWIAEREADLVGCIAIVSAESGGVRDHMGLGHPTKPKGRAPDRHGGARDEENAGSGSLATAPVTGAAPHEDVAQLRWFLVHPSVRGQGLGRRMLGEAVRFSQDNSYASIQLWTVSSLTSAARLYRSFGFVKVEEKPGRMWGVDVVEEKYAMELCATGWTMPSS